MRKKSVNTLLVLGTTLVEDTSTEITPVPIEQTN